MSTNEQRDSTDGAGRDASLHWTLHTIDELSARELHGLMKLRVDVFVVEQACAYPEVDELDALPDTVHLIVRSGTEVVATARAMAPALPGKSSAGGIAAKAASGIPEDTATSTSAARIGRVAVHPAFRGQGLAREMMVRLMQEIVLRFGWVDIVLGAQTAALRLYEGLGFKVISDAYLEDGIEHVDMRYRPADAPE